MSTSIMSAPFYFWPPCHPHFFFQVHHASLILFLVHPVNLILFLSTIIFGSPCQPHFISVHNNFEFTLSAPFCFCPPSQPPSLCQPHFYFSCPPCIFCDTTQKHTHNHPLSTPVQPTSVRTGQGFNFKHPGMQSHPQDFLLAPGPPTRHTPTRPMAVLSTGEVSIVSHEYPPIEVLTDLLLTVLMSHTICSMSC